MHSVIMRMVLPFCIGLIESTNVIDVDNQSRFTSSQHGFNFLLVFLAISGAALYVKKKIDRASEGASR